MDSFKAFSVYWLLSIVLIFSTTQILYSLTALNWAIVPYIFLQSSAALLACSTVLLISQVATPKILKPSIKYVCFFIISITSMLGLTATMNGFYAQSQSALLYGLSFYTASIAYLIHHNRLSSIAIPVVANPLLLITGPIATEFRSINYKSIRSRSYYYFPFIIVGLFLNQVIARPLTETFKLVSSTDALSAISFAFIFEIFVYANFCGLSLMVYGALGTMGLKVPLNFKQPFSATNLVDYWRGWHRTLSMVLKSLFYSPTKQAIGTNTAILVVFVSSALWHGVTINFLLWGFFHSVLYILTLFLLRKRAKLLPFSVMVIGVIIGRLLFSDSNTARLFEKLEFKYDGVHVFYELSHLPHSSLLALILGVTFITMEFVFRKHELFRSRNYKFYRIPAVQLVLLLLTLSFMTSEVGIDYAVYGQR